MPWIAEERNADEDQVCSGTDSRCGVKNCQTSLHAYGEVNRLTPKAQDIATICQQRLADELATSARLPQPY